MRGSVVWYSRYITHRLGAIKFKNYLNKFNYGNKNVESKVTLMNSWLGNSLKISPLEQITFIEKLVSKSLPVTKKSQEITIDIIKIETIYDDFQLYGKTGGGKSSGWFVGWIEKNNKNIIFAQYIEQSENSLINAGKMAKEVAKDNLMSLLARCNKFELKY